MRIRLIGNGAGGAPALTLLPRNAGHRFRIFHERLCTCTWISPGRPTDGAARVPQGGGGAFTLRILSLGAYPTLRRPDRRSALSTDTVLLLFERAVRGHQAFHVLASCGLPSKGQGRCRRVPVMFQFSVPQWFGCLQAAPRRLSRPAMPVGHAQRWGISTSIPRRHVAQSCSDRLHPVHPALVSAWPWGFLEKAASPPHVSALVSLQISRFDPMPHPPECRRTGKATANSPIGKSLFGICRSLQAIPLPPISELRIRKAGRSGDCQAIPGFPGSPPHALACGLPALGEGDVSRTGDPGRRFVVRWAYVWVTVVRTSTWQPGIRLLLTV